jgi:hypothetical protein
MRVALAFLGATACSAADHPLDAGASVDTTSAELAPCRAPETPTTLVTGGITGVAITSAGVLFVDRALKQVDFAGGEPETFATVDSAYGLTVTGDTAYFIGNHYTGEATAQGRRSSESALYSASASEPGDAELVLDGFSSISSAAAAGSAYFESAVLGDIVSLKPPSAFPRTFNAPKIGIRALFVHGSDLYIAGQDFTAPEGDHGILARVSISTGVVTKVLGLAGLPNDIAVDDSAIYWVEESPYGTFDTSHIARAKLDGTQQTTLTVTEATSIALDRDNVYFVSDRLGRVPKRGGAVETLAADLEGPGLLRISGSDAVWVNLAGKAMSDPRPSMLQALCVHPPR